MSVSLRKDSPAQQVAALVVALNRVSTEVATREGHALYAFLGGPTITYSRTSPQLWERIRNTRDAFLRANA